MKQIVLCILENLLKEVLKLKKFKVKIYNIFALREFRGIFGLHSLCQYFCELALYSLSTMATFCDLWFFTSLLRKDNRSPFVETWC